MIGCGDVTEVKSGPAFSKVPDSQLVAVMRRNGEKAADYARRHNVPRWYDDADKLIDDPEVNAVYIATPPGSHCEYTIRVAEAGKPVYVEKPMARTYSECNKMIKACETAGVPLFVAYYRRTLPNHVKVKELVDTGAVGDLRFVNVRLYWPTNWQIDLSKGELPWRVDPEIAGGGYFFDLASHTFDFLDFIFGPVERATGIIANQAGLYKAEDIVTANFNFSSGVIGSGLWCFTVDESTRTEITEIVGSEGRITFHSFGPGPVRLETAAGIQEFEPEMPQHVHQPLVQTVVDELLGRGKCPSTGVSGARANWVLDEIVKNR
jgi:predicted dehydrogenase